MKKYILLFLSLILVSCGESNEPAEGSGTKNLLANYESAVKKYGNKVNNVPPDVIKRFMYVNGYRMALEMQDDSLFFDLDYLLQGFADALKKSGNPLLPVDSMDQIVNDFSNFMTARNDSLARLRDIEISVMAVQNADEAAKFLEENSKKSGIITLPSGLQYKVIKDGSGLSPLTTDWVLVHMTSRFVDGTVFDDTRQKEPRGIPNEQMIAGWKEAITMMKAGSRWELYIPPALAFGESGADGMVPPSKCIIIDVELINIMNESEVQEYIRKNPPKMPVPGGPIQTR